MAKHENDAPVDVIGVDPLQTCDRGDCMQEATVSIVIVNGLCLQWCQRHAPEMNEQVRSTRPTEVHDHEDVPF